MLWQSKIKKHKCIEYKIQNENRELKTICTRRQLLQITFTEHNQIMPIIADIGMDGCCKQKGDSHSPRAPGLTSGYLCILGFQLFRLKLLLFAWSLLTFRLNDNTSSMFKENDFYFAYIRAMYMQVSYTTKTWYKRLPCLHLLWRCRTTRIVLARRSSSPFSRPATVPVRDLAQIRLSHWTCSGARL